MLAQLGLELLLGFSSGAVTRPLGLFDDGAQDVEAQEGAAVTPLFDRDRPSHPLDEALGDGEAETGSAELAGGRSVRLDEGVEEPLGALRLDADARVLDLELEAAAAFVGGPLHAESDRTLSRELDGVAHEVGEHLAQPVRVAER